jgi:hypothetical protein
MQPGNQPSGLSDMKQPNSQMETRPKLAQNAPNEGFVNARSPSHTPGLGPGAGGANPGNFVQGSQLNEGQFSNFGSQNQSLSHPKIPGSEPNSPNLLQNPFSGNPDKGQTHQDSQSFQTQPQGPFKGQNSHG